MEKDFFKKVKNDLPSVRKNVSLARYTTFKIGGSAQFFFEAKNEKDIIRAVKAAKKNNLPFFVLGGGSNLLISDKGYDGLVIKIQCNSFRIKQNSEFKVQGSSIYAGAGIHVSKLVKEAGKLGLSGLEWAGGLPGTLGGAIRGNAGAFGGEIKDIVFEVRAIDKKGNLRKLSNKECKFSYRNSIFKKRNWIVIFANLFLKKGNKKQIQSIAKNHIKYRKEKHPLEYPSAGSVFKNYPFKKIPPKIKAKFANALKKDPFPVIPSAFIISEAGLKGKKIGRAQVSEKHPNYIVNLGKASSNDVKDLIKKIKQRVKNKFSIVLEEEIQYFPVNFFKK